MRNRVWHLVSRLFSIFWEYRSRSRKFWSRKKVSVSVSKIFGLEKKSRSRSQKFWSWKKVSVLVSKIFDLEKKSRSRSQKFWSQKKVSVSVSMKFFGLVTQWLYIHTRSTLEMQEYCHRWCGLDQATWTLAWPTCTLKQKMQKDGNRWCACACDRTSIILSLPARGNASTA